MPHYNSKNRSSYAKRRVADVKHDMELVYGKGLVGLKNPETGVVDPKRFGWDRKQPLEAIYVEINGKQYDGISWETFAFGYVEGVQYSGISSSTVSIGGISNSVA